MADYYMDDSTWNAKKADIDEWFGANPEYQDRKVITDGLFAIGDIQTEFRKRHWASIAGVFSGIANTPIGRGRQSLMDVTDKSHADKYLNMVFEAAGVFYDTVPETLRLHGKSGGGLYSSLEDGRLAYQNEMVKKTKTFINNGYNAAKSENNEKRFWVSFNADGNIVVVDRNSSMGVDEEE